MYRLATKHSDRLKRWHATTADFCHQRQNSD